ncbi:MAG: MaoC family dehydratase N-terminal domain-containing protein [Betaproteobacteria bacterium]|nr:MaoC family dehydratase N-terminal domain-containing protein [Betaproteobacteria bacterium]
MAASVEVIRGTERKITDEMVSQVQAEIGKEYPSKDQYNTEATLDNIRHWANGIGDLNPLWHDHDYAKSTSYGGIIAPPTFLYSCSGRAGLQGFPGIHTMHLGDDWIFYRPIRLGMKITVTGGVHSLTEKKTSFAGRAYLQTHFRHFRNENQQLLATMYLNQMRTERNTASRTKRYQSQIEPYTEEQLEAVWKGIEAETVRGNVPRYWQDVQVGDEPPPLAKGPLTMSDVVAFKMGWGSHFVHHIRANEHRYWYVKRHPDLPIRNRLNVPDCPEAVHMLSDTAKAIGVPRWYDYGPQREGWFGHLVTNWMGDDGQMMELRVALRKPNLEGDVQWIKGKVTTKQIDAQGRHVVGLDLWSENQNKVVTATGTATVCLPSSPDGRR